MAPKHHRSAGPLPESDVVSGARRRGSRAMAERRNPSRSRSRARSPTPVNPGAERRNLVWNRMRARSPSPVRLNPSRSRSRARSPSPVSPVFEDYQKQLCFHLARADKIMELQRRRRLGGLELTPDEKCKLEVHFSMILLCTEHLPLLVEFVHKTLGDWLSE